MADKTPLPLPNVEYLRECFDHDADAGTLKWKRRPLHHFRNAHSMNTFNAKHAGKTSGSHINNRYLVVPLNGRKYLAHRVIWKLVTGEDPRSLLDHVDANKMNNRFGNLREATKQQNAFNCNRSRANATGYKGVSYDKVRGKFYACIRLNGKTKALGLFDSAQDAHNAYVNAATEPHGKFLRKA